MAEEKDVELAANKSGISVKTLIIIVVIVLVIVAAAVATTVILVSGDSDKSNAKDEHSQASDGEHAELVVKPAIYFELKPDFVINFESDGKANFLSVQIQLMARESEPLDVIQAQMPVLRNNVLLLLSSQKYDVVRTLEGKEKLRKDIMGILKKIIDEENVALKEKNGEDFHEIAPIEAMYFTGFIMQ
ncbi:MAG: flagellar basal body-associated protein FliL [Gammaproteobacteria bacterium]